MRGEKDVDIKGGKRGVRRLTKHDNTREGRGDTVKLERMIDEEGENVSGGGEAAM